MTKKKLKTTDHKYLTSIILRVPDQNGVSWLYNMLEIHHSGREPSICSKSLHTFLATPCQKKNKRTKGPCTRLRSQWLFYEGTPTTTVFMTPSHIWLFFIKKNQKMRTHKGLFKMSSIFAQQHLTGDCLSRADWTKWYKGYHPHCPKLSGS